MSHRNAVSLDGSVHFSFDSVPQQWRKVGSGQGQRSYMTTEDIGEVKINMIFNLSVVSCNCQIALLVYCRFRDFSPDCTLHTAITHVILVVER